MVGDINNLDQLLDKIYKEGLEKAQVESENMLTKVKKECEAMKKDAQEEARTVVSNAQRDASRIAKSMENELQLKGKQLLNDLKQEIENLLSQAILGDPIHEAFADKSFMQKIITEAISHWNPSDDLELTLSRNLEGKIEQNFTKSIEANINNLTISFNDKMQGGFRIAKKGAGYQVSFGEEDFLNLLRSYLTEQTDKILFAKPA